MPKNMLLRFAALILILLSLPSGSADAQAPGMQIRLHWEKLHSNQLPKLQKVARNQKDVENKYIRCRKPIFDFGRQRGGPRKRIICTFPIENIYHEPVWVKPIYGGGTRAATRIDPNCTVTIEIFVNASQGSGKIYRAIPLRITKVGWPD